MYNISSKLFLYQDHYKYTITFIITVLFILEQRTEQRYVSVYNRCFCL